MNEREIINWVGKLPKGELDIPLVVLDNRIYSPNEVLQIIQLREELGIRLLTLGVKRIPTEAQMLELAKIRLKMKLEKTPKKIGFGRYIYGEKATYTAEELIEEIQRETPIGQEFINTEKKLIIDLLKR